MQIVFMKNILIGLLNGILNTDEIEIAKSYVLKKNQQDDEADDLITLNEMVLVFLQQM